MGLKTTSGLVESAKAMRKECDKWQKLATG